MSYGGGKRTARSGYGQSVADQNFGVTAQSILPNLNDGANMSNAKMSDQFIASGSFLDGKSANAQGAGGPATTTGDILFLKRLLFLKAALDNDQTISNFAVPFEEDKAFQLNIGEEKPPRLAEL